jgi:hypothetical protein
MVKKLGNAQDAFQHLNQSQQKNTSLDKMAEQFTSVEELQAYSAAQYNTILSLNTKINELNKQLEVLTEKNKQLNKDLAVAGLNESKDKSQFAVSDEEATCTIQIALIKCNAMDRELTTDEVKRLEIFVKTLQIIKGRNVKDDNSKQEKELAKMSSSELLEYMDKSLKDPQ